MRNVFQFVGGKYVTVRGCGIYHVCEWDCAQVCGQGMYYSSWVRNISQFVGEKYITGCGCKILYKLVSEDCGKVRGYGMHFSSWVRNTVQFAGEKSLRLASVDELYIRFVKRSVLKFVNSKRITVWAFQFVCGKYRNTYITVCGCVRNAFSVCGCRIQ